MMKKIKLTRASVAMADDVNAPHLLDISIEPQWTIVEILNHIVRIRYLPRISGGDASWSVAINEPIAVLSQKNMAKPMLICFPDYPYYGTRAYVDIQHIHFNYHAQKSAQEVYDVLSRFNLE